MQHIDPIILSNTLDPNPTSMVSDSSVENSCLGILPLVSQVTRIWINQNAFSFTPEKIQCRFIALCWLQKQAYRLTHPTWTWRSGRVERSLAGRGWGKAPRTGTRSKLRWWRRSRRRRTCSARKAIPFPPHTAPPPSPTGSSPPTSSAPPAPLSSGPSPVARLLPPAAFASSIRGGIGSRPFQEGLSSGEPELSADCCRCCRRHRRLLFWIAGGGGEGTACGGLVTAGLGRKRVTGTVAIWTGGSGGERWRPYPFWQPNWESYPISARFIIFLFISPFIIFSFFILYISILKNGFFLIFFYSYSYIFNIII